MALSKTEQIRQLIQEKNRIFITYGAGRTGDAIGSSVALALFLERLGKHVDIVSDQFVLLPQFQFLKKAKTIAPELSTLQTLVVSVPIAKAQPDALSYDVHDGSLRIFITPSKDISPRDVAIAKTAFAYDLIITLDTPDLASLGAVYADHADFFYAVPIVNIDHQIDNAQFGAVNLVDATRDTTAEVVFGLLQSLDAEQIDTEIATGLLVGIIAHTRSFSVDTMKPQTLTTASALVLLGANRDAIVSQLFRTRSVSTLRLWGEALRTMNYDRASGLITLSISREDFSQAQATAAMVEDLIDELLLTSAEARLVVIVYATEKETRAIVSAPKNMDLKKILASYSPIGTATRVAITLPDLPLKQAEEIIVERLKA